MASWYGILMNHQSKHRELLREAERDRLTKAVVREQSSVHPPNASKSPSQPVPSGDLRPAEQA